MNISNKQSENRKQLIQKKPSDKQKDKGYAVRETFRTQSVAPRLLQPASINTNTCWMSRGDIRNHDKKASYDKRKNQNEENSNEIKTASSRSDGASMMENDEGWRSGNVNVRNDQDIYKKKSKPKLVNVNHLLNFKSYSSNKDHQNERISHNTKRQIRRVPFNRDVFLQASFRYLVSNNIDLKSHFSDADKMFDWEDVLRVEMTINNPIMCPITLEKPPVCPQITPCGHVFHFPAITRHVLLHGGKRATCPLCYAPFCLKELRAVDFHLTKALKINEKCIFRLLATEIGNIRVKKARSVFMSEDDDFIFNKFHISNNDMDIFRQDAIKLANYASMVISEGGLEAEYETPALYASIDCLSKRVREWVIRKEEKINFEDFSKKTQSKIIAKAKEAQKEIENIFQTAISAVMKKKEERAWLKKLEEEFPCLIAENNQAQEQASSSHFEDIEISFEEEEEEEEVLVTTENNYIQYEEEDYYEEELISRKEKEMYFYQSDDGQWSFLHPTCIKCLLSYYGTFQNFPELLEAEITHIEEVEQSYITRRRLKHLSHIPIRGIFKLVEIDLSEYIPYAFMEPLRKRNKEREKKFKKEMDQLNKTKIKDEFSQFHPIHQNKKIELTMEDFPLALIPDDEPQKNKQQEIKAKSDTTLNKKDTISFAFVTKHGNLKTNKNHENVIMPIWQSAPEVEIFNEKEDNVDGMGMKKKKKKKKSKKCVLFSNVQQRK